MPNTSQVNATKLSKVFRISTFSFNLGLTETVKLVEMNNIKEGPIRYFINNSVKISKLESKNNNSHFNFNLTGLFKIIRKTQ